MMNNYPLSFHSGNNFHFERSDGEGPVALPALGLYPQRDAHLSGLTEPSRMKGTRGIRGNRDLFLPASWGQGQPDIRKKKRINIIAIPLTDPCTKL
jgi:hypothetical protein